MNNAVIMSKIRILLFISLILVCSCKKSGDESSIVKAELTEEETIINNLLSLVGPETQPSTEITSLVFSDDEKEMLNKGNAMAFDYLQSQQNNKNIVYSPLSLCYVLGMLSAGSNDATFSQIRDYFGGVDKAGINNYFKKLYNGTRALDNLVTLSTANLIAINQRSNIINEAYPRALADYYSAVSLCVDFNKPSFVAQVLNKWVSLHTNDLIDKLIKAEDVYGLAILINTLYAKGAWKDSFIPTLTKKDAFSLATGKEIQIDYMTSLAFRTYGKKRKYSFIHLPIGKYQNHYALSIIFPNKDTSIDETLLSLKNQGWQNSISDGSSGFIKLVMPKFSIEQDLKLSDYLKGKGITDAFDINRADFSGITGSKSKKFAIGLVKQKSKIEIDEKGLEAASASAVVGYGLNPDDPQEIKETIIINRPFVYVLSDIESGLILFAGVFAGE